MKGAVFISFNELVEKEFGLDMWEELLDKVNPESGGIYTSVEDFPDQELFSLVTMLSEITEVPIPKLVEHFGHHLFGTLSSKYAIFLDNSPSFFEFIESIDDVIHKEVRKLYHNPNLPELETKRFDEKTLEVKYRSPRKLCHLALGLMRGAAEYYKVNVEMSHDICLHTGSDHCQFILKLK